MVGNPLADPTQATRRLYAADWGRFTGWCRAHGREPIPASPATLAAHLLAIAPGLSRGALGRRRAAIGTVHRQAGLPVPRLDAATRKALRASARPATRQAAVPAGTDLHRMAVLCSRDLAGLRDRALLLLAATLARPSRSAGAATGARSGAAWQAVPRLFLLALDAEHVRLTGPGMTLQVRSRSDEAEPSRFVTLTRALPPQACPVRAMEDWLRASDTTFGPVFRRVDRWGNVEHSRLHPDAWSRILARRGIAPRPPPVPPRRESR